MIYAKEFDRASYEKMISLVSKLKVKYRPTKIYVDASKPEFIKSLKSIFNEQTNYDKVIDSVRKQRIDFEYRMFAIPVSSNEFGKELLGRFNPN